jgi:tetratricopeptide (TPR) repeat protein
MIREILLLLILTAAIFIPIQTSASEIPRTTKPDVGLIKRLIERCLEITRSLPNDDEEYDSTINPRAQDVRSSRARIQEDVAVSQAMAGDIQTALQTISTIEDPSWRNPGLLKIVQAQTDAGDLTGAKDTAMSTITDIAYLDTALGVIGQKYATVGEMEKASAIFPDYGFGKAKHFLNIAAAQARANDAKRALRTYEEALKKSEEEGTTSTFRRDTLLHLIEFQMRADDYGGALETSKLIPDGKKISYLEMLAKIHTGVILKSVEFG